MVIILASWPRADFEDRRRNIDVDSADTRSVLAVMAVQSFCDELQRTSVLPMKVELHLTRYREEAENAAHRGKLNLTCIAA